MEECTIERQKGNSKTLHGMPRKIKGGACQDSSGVGLFLSVEDALEWAYLVSARPIIKVAMINTMRRSYGAHRYSNALLVDLTVQDMHGQAALIIGLVDSLHDPAARELIKTRFGKRVEPDDLRVLVYRGCAGLGLGLDKQEGVYKIIRGYFGKEASMRSIMRALGCRHQHAVMSRRALFDVLDVINLEAMSELRGIMEERGLVQPSRSG